MFVAMLAAFRRTGGLARDREVLARCHASRLPISIIDGVEVTPIHFEWGGRFWLPWFQLEPSDLSMRPGPGRIIAVLAPAFDGWDTAKWFAQPNPAVGFARPVDLVDRCLERLLGAARADCLQRCRPTARS